MPMHFQGNARATANYEHHHDETRLAGAVAMLHGLRVKGMRAEYIESHPRHTAEVVESERQSWADSSRHDTEDDVFLDGMSQQTHAARQATRATTMPVKNTNA